MGEAAREGQDFRDIVIGVAGMDDERQPGLARRRDMADEALALHITRGVVVVVVEPGLADGDHLRLRGDGDEIGGRHVGFLGGVVGMRADRTVDAVVAIGQRLQRRKSPDPGRDRHHGLDPGGTSPVDDRIPIRFEIGEIEMAVAVDQNARHPSLAFLSP